MKNNNDIGILKKEFTEKFFHNKDMDISFWRKQFPKDLDKTVVNIPARSGSTRIRDKNIKELCGMPLLGYTIKLAKAVFGVDRIVVNTDSSFYAEVAESLGAEVPFLRPPEISTATSNSYWAYYYLFRKLIDEDYPVKTIITLAPTNPFRNKIHLEELIKKLKECGYVQTAMPVNLTNKIILLQDESKLKTIEQNLSSKISTFKTLGHFTGQNCLHEHIRHKYIEFLTNPIELVDIDEEDDFVLAQSVIERGLYDFGIEI